MPRRAAISQRVVSPDPRYNDKLVSKLINVIMRKGKKSTAEKICYQAMDSIKTKTGNDPLKVFKTAMDNVKPMLEVKSRRVGGASYQVPVEIRPNRRLALALRWLTQFAQQRSGKSMQEKLAAEILDASNNTGGAIKKKEDTHRMAEANKAFAHYRW
ncbi:MAG TPA: 30S ribosomal protein S7 [Nitrospiria bacterium]|jgi:small subunit ribosomal protein S7|nr:30S ribosomal protein S7 [Nitrospiria bacterium]